MRCARLAVWLFVVCLCPVSRTAARQPAVQEPVALQPCAMPHVPPVSREQNLFTPEQAAILGDIVMEQVGREFKLVGDAALSAYLQTMADRMSQIAGLSNVRVALVDFADANAVTLPGARILVGRKLVAFARSEDEIAGVLAHEFGHILQRDGERHVSALLRTVLKVSSLGDRPDIAEKYNRLVESQQRRGDVGSDRESEKEQQVADQLGIWLMARAGYPPKAYLDVFDRLAELQSKTGNWLSDLFGRTRPDAKRLRSALQATNALPAECTTPRGGTAAQFSSWQQRVVEASRGATTAALHGVVGQMSLEPALRSDLGHLRFSPDGKWILAQDDSNLYLFTREPLAFVFRIDAPDAYPAQFSADSGSVVFCDENYRVERWNPSSRAREWVREVVLTKGCFESTLSSDGAYLACVTPDFDLRILDVAKGDIAFERKHFYVATIADALWLLFGRFDEPDRHATFFQMHFSPDGRYFVAAHDLTVQALDMAKRAPISLPGAICDRVGTSFSFLGNDRIVGVHTMDAQKSAIVTFPQGEVQSTLRLGRQTVAAVTRGDRYVMLRGIKGYDVTVFDVIQGKVFLGNTAPGFDIYEDVSVGERKGGELALYRAHDNALLAVVNVPTGQLGRLRAADISPDFGMLAISQTSRGGAWDMKDGQRRLLTRGFRGVYFETQAQALADFPKDGKTPRLIASVDAATRRTTPLVGIEPPAEANAASQGKQAEERRALDVPRTIVGTDLVHRGRFLVGWKETKKSSDPPTMVVYEASTGKELWTRPFPKGAPDLSAPSHHDMLALYWAYTSDGARPILEANPELKTRFEVIKAKKDADRRHRTARTGERQDARPCPDRLRHREPAAAAARHDRRPLHLQRQHQPDACVLAWDGQATGPRIWHGARRDEERIRRGGSERPRRSGPLCGSTSREARRTDVSLRSRVRTFQRRRHAVVRVDRAADSVHLDRECRALTIGDSEAILARCRRVLARARALPPGAPGVNRTGGNATLWESPARRAKPRGHLDGRDDGWRARSPSSPANRLQAAVAPGRPFGRRRT
jgi:hypothetical protein